MQFLAAMMHPGGGRNDIPARLKRQYFILNITIPSEASVDRIFSTMLSGFFCPERKFSADVCSMVSKLPSLTRRLWQMTKTKMLPTPAKVCPMLVTKFGACIKSRMYPAVPLYF